MFFAFFLSFVERHFVPLRTRWYTVVEREQPLVEIAISCLYPLVRCCRESNRWLQMCLGLLLAGRIFCLQDVPRTPCSRMDRCDDRDALYGDAVDEAVADEAVADAMADEVVADAMADEAVNDGWWSQRWTR